MLKVELLEGVFGRETGESNKVKAYLRVVINYIALHSDLDPSQLFIKHTIRLYTAHTAFMLLDEKTSFFLKMENEYFRMTENPILRVDIQKS